MTVSTVSEGDTITFTPSDTQPNSKVARRKKKVSPNVAAVTLRPVSPDAPADFTALYEDADRHAARLLSALLSVLAEIRLVYSEPDAYNSSGKNRGEHLSDALLHLFGREVPEIEQFGKYGEGYGVLAKMLFGADGAGRFGSPYHEDACGSAHEGFQIAQIMMRAGCDRENRAVAHATRDFLLAAAVAAERGFHDEDDEDTADNERSV